MNTMSLDIIFSNKKLIDQHNVIMASNPEAVISGKLSLGVKGDRLVFVQNSTSIITRVLNFFRGISTDVKLVGKVLVATQLAFQKDTRLLAIANQVNDLNPACKGAIKSSKLQAELDVAKKGDIVTGAKMIFNGIFTGRTHSHRIGGHAHDGRFAE